MFCKSFKIILVMATIFMVVQCAPRRNANVGIDVGPFFQMGLIKDRNRGTVLGLNVLDGLVNVGVDRRRFGGYGGNGRRNSNVFVGVGNRRWN